MAITLVNQRDMRNLKDIEDLIGYEIERIPLPKEIGKGPEWTLRPPQDKRNKKKFYGKKKGFKGKRNFKKPSGKGNPPPKNH